MTTIEYLIDLIVNINLHLNILVKNFGMWTYFFLFLIIFCETGLVIMPFLPGDSLLFAIGIITAKTDLNLNLIIILLSTAAIMGDNLNYWLGHLFGENLFKENAKILKKSHLEKTHKFFEKHGSKAIIIARFIPVIRTFTPFAAGVGAMSYKKFMLLSVLAAFIWVGSITYIGHFFSNIPVVKDNFKIIIVSIIIISITPAVFEIIKSRIRERQKRE